MCWLTGKLGRAWHRCMAVHAASCMGGVPDGGLGKSMCILPGWKKCMYVLSGFGVTFQGS